MSYIPDPLARFLDRLRLDLTPDCKPRAHVTVLPPRPLSPTAHLKSTIEELAEECRISPPFEVVLGDVDIFPVTNVIYVNLARGERELHALHENLNSGQLEYDGPFPYHPHITIAQDIAPGQVQELAAIARERWASYDGPRGFPVDCLSFVQNVAPGTWLDVASLPLAVPVSAGR
ncbi:MAG TPA: 2'-5' RNA ligase family protein [Bryobacteraceae bacterium]|nr:2'-5' RNA ligase family protein [Bryobacteraceae bacterium]